jgi:hypothetical protein
VHIELDELITIDEPSDLRSCSLTELRSIRDQYRSVENGISYARRIVQGRLDTLAVELERREETPQVDGLLDRLPDALATHSRGPGLPRPVMDLEPPDWADRLLESLEEVLPPARLAELANLDRSELATAASRIGELERELSAQRNELHQHIDRVQDELVGRYRDGAAVDDLLA